MKKMSIQSVLWLAGLTLTIGMNARSANVEPGIGYTNAFAAQPPASDWATSSQSGGGGDSYTMDTEVNANIRATSVTAQVPSNTGNPPSASATAAWSSTGQYVQTRPTGNRYTTLMGKFVNNTGTNATEIALSYLFTIAGGGTSEELGQRVYYSLSGLASSWVNLPTLSTTASANGSSAMSTNLSLNWTNGGDLYLLWVDDNANFGTDGANQIDNFSLQVTAGSKAFTELGCIVAMPTNQAAVLSGTPLTALAATGGGTPPYTVSYWTNRGEGNTTFALAGSSSQEPYTVELGAWSAGVYNIYASVADDDGLNANSPTNTFTVANPLELTLTSPAANATFNHTANVIGTATVSGGTAPFSVQFHLDGLPAGAPVTAPPYSSDFGALIVGDHTIQATVTDANGWPQSSALHTIHITGPVFAILSPTNETALNYGESLILEADVAGGTAPYSTVFYVNDQPYGPISSPPLATNLGILPVGSYTCYVHAIDSTLPNAGETNSEISVVTILPNPLDIVLLTPTNGQTIATNLGVFLRASATVNAPITIGQVEIFLDGFSIGTVNSEPYLLPVADPSLGIHHVYAVATDSLGRQSFSATNQVTFEEDPLANDNFANRMVLFGAAANLQGSNVGATMESGEPSNSGFFNRWGASLWYSWTAPITGTVVIDTFGSSFNTVLGVYRGTRVNALSQVAFNNDYPGQNNASFVSFTAQEGTEYQIQVAGVQSFGQGGGIATGNFQLHLGMPPTISITSPTNQNIFITGNPITLAADAESPAGTVVQVDFYRQDVLVGTSLEEPYSMVLSNAPAGSNSLYAVVTDTTGQMVTSAVVNVLVANLGLTLLSPTDGNIFMSISPIAVSALGILDSGAFELVDFFVNDQKFGEATNAPFAATWNNVAGGSHRITAVGRTDTGASYKSQPVNIAVAQGLVNRGAVWKYLDDGSDQGTNWISPAFDDEDWEEGPAELGYGDNDEETVVGYGPNSNNRFITTYFRHSFLASNVASFASVLLSVKRDDGAVVYLNGMEAGRFNMNAGPVTYTTTAPNAEDEGEDFHTLEVPQGLLVEGVNVLAAEIHQSGATSSDISFDLELLGIPEVIRNFYPVVALDSPGNREALPAPANFTLEGTAFDEDGEVVNVEFYANGVKLGEAQTSPYRLTWADVPAGVYQLTAVATDDYGAQSVSEPIEVSVHQVAETWVAYNDHGLGPETHRNATTWSPFGLWGLGTHGPLRNIDSGAALPVTLSLTHVNALSGATNGTPSPGTPAHALFSGYVDFSSGAILLGEGRSVTHTFTGLDPQRRYGFRGTAIGGSPAGGNAWTRFAIVGASSYSSAHTINLLTAQHQPQALGPNEAAMNTGDNRSGDVVGWDEIIPAADGSFSIVSSQYRGPAPGNDVPAIFTYAPVAVRLSEIGPVPIAWITAPPDGLVVEGPTNLSMTAEARAVGGVSEVLFVGNGAIVGRSPTAPFNAVWNDIPFGSNHLVSVALGNDGSRATSAPIFLTITIPPTNVVAPTVVSQNPSGGATIASLSMIEVGFSETVVGVEASDLLVNGAPALEVSGQGSNYAFTVEQPAYGPVTVRWAADHGITDLGWPANLAFDSTAPGASWDYTLIDLTPPTVTSQQPPANAALSTLTQITVTFSEGVSGVDAADLLVNNLPAYAVSGSSNQYTFKLSQPASGPVIVSWAADHGIQDLATTPNAFSVTGPGATWLYTLDAKTVLVESNSFWHFVKGFSEASDPMDAWRLPGFDDSSWLNAAAPFFYGDPYSNGIPAYTHLDDMRGYYTSIYLRQPFGVPNALNITNLVLRAQIDDGMIVWINGVEVYRQNMPQGDIPFDGTASGTAQEPFGQNGVSYQNYQLPGPSSYLVSGTNWLTVHAFNESLSDSSDFGFNAQLFTYLADPELVTPTVVKQEPAAGYTLFLTNIVVTFSEPVEGVNASDLLINGSPATGVSDTSNLVYTFSFPQPPYGDVAVVWAADHSIVDQDMEPKPFNQTGPGATWEYTLVNPTAPYLVTVTPAQGATVLNQLTQIEVLFSEAVTGVDASDLLVNGFAASSLAGSGASYVFTFTQPAYGTVTVGWAVNHGIADLDSPSESFNTSWPGHTWNYQLVDQMPPVVVSQNPIAGAFVTNLTGLTIAFSESVTGVNASDLLVNGRAATSVAGSGANYSFTFAQPNASRINLAWAVNHGIRDLATAPNSFDASAPGATWSYDTLDNLAPSVASLTPAASSTVRSLTQITVTFDEPVNDVDYGDLLINGQRAEQLTGSGAGPYVFTFTQPPLGEVQMAWAPGHDIQDLAPVSNPFPGGAWTYVIDTNLPPPTFTRGPYLQIQTPTSMVVRWRTATATDSRVQYGKNAQSRTNVIDDPALVTDHIVTLTNLTPDTRYVYACGTTDGALLIDTNFYFATAPPVGTVRPIRIWYVSDFGFGDASERAVRDSYFNHVAAEKSADVWITGGDNDQRSGTESGYTEYVFGTNYAYGALMRNLAVWPTIGNHDYSTAQGANYYAAFSLPTKAEAGGVPSGSEHYYSFNYGNVHFLTLDGIDGTLSSSTNTAMINWLREDLAANTLPWVIAYWHGPPYTKGSHDSDSTTDTLAWMVQMRQNVLPILEAHGVDLVLCGHSHVHERTWLLHGHYGFSSSFSETHKVKTMNGREDGTGAYSQDADGLGTVYISNGMGGQPRTITNEQHPAHVLKVTGILGSMVIDVNGNRLDGKFVNSTGGVEDYFTLVKSSVGAPQLFVSRANGLMTISWSKSVPAYELRRAVGLEPPRTWESITNGLQTNDTLNWLQFDPSTSAPAGYFRLQTP